MTIHMIHSAGKRWCGREVPTPDDRWHQDSVDCIACLTAVVKTGEACARMIRELTAGRCWCGEFASGVLGREWCHKHAPRCRSGAHFHGNCECKGT